MELRTLYNVPHVPLWGGGMVDKVFCLPCAPSLPSLPISPQLLTLYLSKAAHRLILISLSPSLPLFLPHGHTDPHFCLQLIPSLSKPCPLPPKATCSSRSPCQPSHPLSADLPVLPCSVQVIQSCCRIAETATSAVQYSEVECSADRN